MLSKNITHKLQISFTLLEADMKRDFTELSMMSKEKWSNEELQYYQHALSQILPYINSEGLTILHEINKELHSRNI